MSDLGSYVAQDDALHGFLTVKDNIRYSALLSLPHDTPTNVIDGMVRKTLRSLGLTDVRKNRIGTHFQRGISGGQKRRVTIASSVVTQPRILLCDEPTSGLDSRTGYEVASAIKRLAQETNTVVLASIHQPNFETFSLFDHVLFLAGGHCVYQGPINGVVSYFAKMGYPCPPHMNPADHVINIINTDFDVAAETGVPDHERVQHLAKAWIAHTSSLTPSDSEFDLRNSTPVAPASPGMPIGGFKLAFEPVRLRVQKSWSYRVIRELRRVWILFKRTALIIRRNIMLAGLRFFIFGLMSVLLATIWLHLEKTDARVNDRVSVHFFSIAVFSAVSVAAVPLYLEERPVLIRERNNGLYGAGAYTIANSAVFIPYLFGCSVVYSSIGYWAVGLKSNGFAFCRFVVYVFLGMYAAEAQALLVAAIIPDFVGALAGVGFLIGFWMCVEGFLVRAPSLPRFWYYWAHWIDYQTFVFSLLVQNDFVGETFTCTHIADGSCHCSVPSSLISKGQCALTGVPCYSPLFAALYVGVLIVICLVHRVAFYLVLVFRT
ncbi:hypothetical protein BS47DRAFT_1337557 [Hydnum rufescens UP504]|uniref:ABC transporter domain-containing protein n=1 Tax=Hydnum rufescens UP504 TaxID=1448309 RepID=A0A9P6E1C2_9AGAM|nr:hypothetical protein BS47DRAFT_1337557 [Hydnum rufescens UP504]